ncbi:hypothetical protein [Mucisphaera sp.]|uniref:hypothetical protein n=1 Tax=Mucisphaera sp. TaxID=2913024 RepID=UPI003D1521B4
MIDPQHQSRLNDAGIDLDALPDDHPGLAIRRAADRCFHEVEELAPQGYIVQGFLIPFHEVVAITRTSPDQPPPACDTP